MMKKQIELRDKNDAAKRYQGRYPKNDLFSFMQVLKIMVGGYGYEYRATAFFPV